MVWVLFLACLGGIIKTDCVLCGGGENTRIFSFFGKLKKNEKYEKIVKLIQGKG
jgi:hypothetical protein